MKLLYRILYFKFKNEVGGKSLCFRRFVKLNNDIYSKIDCIVYIILNITLGIGGLVAGLIFSLLTESEMIIKIGMIVLIFFLIIDCVLEGYLAKLAIKKSEIELETYIKGKYL